jgi:hypothetical protein
VSRLTAEDESVSAKVETALMASNVPMTIEDLCYKIFGGPNKTNIITVSNSLRHLARRGAVQKHPARYTLKGDEIPFG